MEEYNISVGRSRTETAWMPKATTWEALKTRLNHNKRTAESVADYRAMTRTQKGKVKDIGGFVGGTINGGRRKATAEELGFSERTLYRKIKELGLE